MSRPTAISLFSGLGGIDIGLHRAGIETRVCIEKDTTAAKTLRANSRRHSERPVKHDGLIRKLYPWTVIEDDIYDVTSEEILDAAALRDTEIDLVVGGPPCQTFSRSNEGSREGTEAERGMLYEEYARVLRDIQPKGFIFENVRGLASSNDGRDLQIIKDELSSAGYTISHSVVNAADYGVPQTRERLIILGLRSGDRPYFPEPSHVEAKNTITDKASWVSAGTVLDDFNVDQSIEQIGGYENAVGGKYGYLLRDVPPGANYQHFSERKYDAEQGEYVKRSEEELDEKVFGWRSRHWNYLLKQDPNRPTWTIQADPGTYVGPFHWRSRPFGLTEQMVLMDMPVDYLVEGRPRDVQRQVGNAVPPGLAAALAECLVSQLDVSGAEPRKEPPLESDGGSADRPAVDQSFTINNGTSPWKLADELLTSLNEHEEVVLTARGSKIANAVDVAELARYADRGGISAIVDEQVVGADGVKSETLSEATITLSQG